MPKKIVVQTARKAGKTTAAAQVRRDGSAAHPFTLEDVARGLFQSDGNAQACMTMADCEYAAAYMLKTSLGLRAMIDGATHVALGRGLGRLVIRYEE